jgi:hypothetical protein
MTKILTALTFAVVLGLSLASAYAESEGGTVGASDASLAISTAVPAVMHRAK